MKTPDLSGRSAVVTGANSGLGAETAAALARAGAHVVMTARDPEKGARAVQRLRERVPGAHVTGARLDLADLDSVRSFVEIITSTHSDGLDLLVNNAGVMAVPKRRATAQGFELQLGTNHLGHFALTMLLLPLLRSGPAGRVVTLTSLAHRSSRGLDFADLQQQRRYRPWGAYNASKLANALFTVELSRRLRAIGSAVLSVGAHPGLASTNLLQAGPRLGGGGVAARLIGLLGRTPLLTQSAQDGAAPTLMAATAPHVRSGELYGPCCFAETQGRPKLTHFSGPALDPAAGARLWQVSESLTGTAFPQPE